jgi:unsaturated rhamnogalacturonyl hydrolase
MVTTSTFHPVAIAIAIAALMLLPGCASDDAGKLSDDEILRVVNAIGSRQMQSRVLAEGTYPQGSWEQVSAHTPPRGVDWVYPWGVTLYGLSRVGEETGDAAYSSFVLRHNEITARYHQYLRWVASSYSASRPADVSQLTRASALWRLMALGSLDNTGAMSSQMLEGLQRHGATATAEETQLLEIVASYISAQQSRLPDGTFWRPERNQTLWIDDLYMSCPFLVRWSRQTGDRKYIDDAARQVIGMATRQQDADGLWFHGNFVGLGTTSPYKWGRGNGWAMVATVEVLSELPDDHPSRAQLLDILRRHIQGIAPLQAPSGLWRQVLDHSELWEETSCSAMFTYSIARAVRRGWISASNLDLARSAFRGISANVTADGQVNGTCEGTSIGTDLSYYIARQRPPDDIHGPGPVLLAGAELLAAERER